MDLRMSTWKKGLLISLLGLLLFAFGILSVLIACSGLCNCPGGAPTCVCLCSEPGYSFGLVIAAVGAGVIVFGLVSALVLFWRSRA